MQKIINVLKEKALEINLENSGLHAGIFKDEGTFEAIIAKKIIIKQI